MEFDIDRLREFMKVGELSITAPGHYGMSVSTFIHLYELYLTTGINYTQDYHLAIWIRWVDDPKNEIWSKAERDICERIYTGKHPINAFFIPSDKEKKQALSTLKIMSEESDIREFLAHTYRYRRRESLHHIKKKSVRQMIFKRDGYKCKKCKSTENLSVDHIKPVLQGGLDTIDNLQTLCRSCNSKKGAK